MTDPTQQAGPDAAANLDWSRWQAVLFDLDGVVTPTAEVHRHAWREVFTAYLDERAEDGSEAEPYTEQDYYDHVDGKPRYDGVRDFLASRGIELPEGEPDDPSDAETVCGLGNRKNDAFAAILERDGVEAYPGSVVLLDHLRDLGTPLAVVSSSRNAPAVVEAAGLTDRFTLIVHGGLADELGLPGKPKPDTFTYAAKQLGADDAHAVVLEDATSGVAAGRAGSFGLVIGVDRGTGADALREAGADVVVDDLAELVPGGSGQEQSR